MQLERLLLDATGSAPGSSKRSQHVALASKLKKKFPDKPISVKGVEQWFVRGSVPSEWLLRIAALPRKPLNLVDYS